MHILDIDIPSTLRTSSFRIVDASSYDDSIPYQEGSIEIFGPSSSYPFLWVANKGFSLTVNANLLHLNPSNSTILPALPDGTYYIKYSVKPHNKVYIQYAYFRNTKQLNNYYSLCSTIRSKQYAVTNKEYNNDVRHLLWIKDLIDAAKYMAEEKHMLNEANLMYQEASSLILKMETCNVR